MANDVKTSIYPDILILCASTKDSDNALKAAEVLIKAAEKAKVSLKSEIHLSGEIRGHLSAEEIRECKGIIVATDTSVVMKRFAGKQVLVTTTSKAISDPDELIRTILNNEAPLTETIGHSKKEVLSGKEIREDDVLVKVMNSLGRIFPFLVGGAIMQVLALLFRDSDLPLYLFFLAVGQSVFEMLTLILAAYIAYTIAGTSGLMIGFVGGIIAKEGYSLIWLNDRSTALFSSGLLGSLIAGVCAGYITVFLQKLCSKMPSSLTMIRINLIYPIIGILMISTVMFFLNNFLSDLNRSFAGFVETIGLNDQLLALIILLLVLVISLVIPKIIKDRNI